MLLFELYETEDVEPYAALAAGNGARQYDFLLDAIGAAIAVGRPMISHTVIKALNYHAIVCLHVSAGEYRPCNVEVGLHRPPAHYRVNALMDDFVDQINRSIGADIDPVYLAAWALWRLNYIHPFINGNGRTARAVAYFILCIQLGGALPGRKILPVLIHDNRDEYVAALQSADVSFAAKLPPNLAPLIALMHRLLEEQEASVGGNVESGLADSDP